MPYYTQTVAGCFVLEEQRTGSLEHPNLPLNDPGLWETVFADSAGTDAGISVTANKALMCAPVWQAVTIISSDVAKLPLKVYRVLVEDDIEYYEPQRNHRLTWRLSNQPNIEDTAVDFWSRVMVHALLWNNVYIYVADDGDLLTLLPDRTQPERVDGELIYVTEANGKLVPLLASRVLHVKGLSITGMADLSLIQQAKNSIALSLAQERFASKFLECYGQYTAAYPLRSRIERAKTLARMGLYRAAGWLHAARPLIARRWDPLTPDARASYAEAKSTVGRIAASVGGST